MGNTASHTNLTEVYDALQNALAESKKADEALEAARAKLMPLEEVAMEMRNSVDRLMNQWRGLTGMIPGATTSPTRRRTRTPKVPATPKEAAPTKRKYTTTPEVAIDSQFRRTLTRAKNSGKSASEALKLANHAAGALASKLGVAFHGRKKA